MMVTICVFLSAFVFMTLSEDAKKSSTKHLCFQNDAQIGTKFINS